MNIETVTIPVKGLKKNYIFLHISDCHIYTTGPADDETDAAFTKERYEKGAWTPIPGLPPIDAFREALDYVKEVRPDALIITGDAVDYVSPSNVAFMKEQISALGVETLYVFGNHEGGHYKKQVSARDCYPQYASLMSGTPDVWVRDYGDLLVLGVDDSDHALTEAQLEKVKAHLSRGIPVLLTLHVPLDAPVVHPEVARVWRADAPHFLLGYDPEKSMPTTLAFCELIKTPDSPVFAILAGHTHFAHSSEFAPGRMQYIAAPTFERYIRRVELVPEN